MTDMRRLLRDLRRSGYRVEKAKRGAHIKVYDGDRLIAVAPHTPGDKRAIHNFMAELRRRGAA